MSPSDDDTEVLSSMQSSDDRTPGAHALADDGDADAELLPSNASTTSMSSLDEAGGGGSGPQHR